MPITVDWYDDSQHIVLMSFDGPWSLEDLYEAMDRQAELANSATSRIDTVSDFTHAGDVPKNVLSHFPAIASKISPQVDRSVMVGVNSGFIRTTTSIFNQIYKKLDVKNTVEEAVAYLNETRTEA